MDVMSLLIIMCNDYENKILKNTKTYVASLYITLHYIMLHHMHQSILDIFEYRENIEIEAFIKLYFEN